MCCLSLGHRQCESLKTGISGTYGFHVFFCIHNPNNLDSSLFTNPAHKRRNPTHSACHKNFMYMKNLKYLFLMLFAVLAFASCEEKDEDKEPTFSTYFKMSITNCERVGDNLKVDFTMKNISGEDLQQVQLNGGSVWDMCKDNTGQEYYSELSLGSSWQESVRASMKKGETINGAFLIKNFNASSKANRLNLIFACSCSSLDFQGRGEFDNLKIADNRILSDGICTNDLGLEYALKSATKKMVNGQYVADITFTVKNNTGEDLYDFQLTTNNAKDNTDQTYYYMGISLDGSNFKTGISGKLLQSATKQYTVRIENVAPNAKAFTFPLYCSATSYPFGDTKAGFYDIAVK